MKDRSRTRQLAPAVAFLFIGPIGLHGLSSGPQFASIRSVDVLRLLASGASFGIASVFIAGSVRGRRAGGV